MKNFVVIFLLFSSFVIGLVPFYSGDKTIPSNVEKQLEEVSVSEIYTHTTRKVNYNLKVANANLLSLFKKYPTFTLSKNCEVTSSVPKICKYGLRVLLGSFLN